MAHDTKLGRNTFLIGRLSLTFYKENTLNIKINTYIKIILIRS